jgi:predicted ester cyclase
VDRSADSSESSPPGLRLRRIGAGNAADAAAAMQPRMPRGRLTGVTDLLQRLLRLWTEPVGDGFAATAAFSALYADPLVVNGRPMTVAQLVDRARSLQKAFDGLSMQIVDRIDTSDRLVIAFLMRGRHVGPYASPLGTIPPTGRRIEVRTIDVLTVEDGLVSAIWVVADDLGLLTQLDAITLPGEP